MITETESTTQIDEYDPSRELEGVHPKIRSCKSCIHASVCKIFELQSVHNQRLAEVAKRSQIDLDITPAEAIGSRCSAYQSGTLKEVPNFSEQNEST